jgi:hypothetical protein
VKTIADFVREVLAVEDEASARALYVRHVAELLDGGQVEDPYVAARLNIGWCFGEGMTAERRAMWRAACGAAHPVFGAMERDPDPEEALATGLAAGRASRSR